MSYAFRLVLGFLLFTGVANAQSPQQWARHGDESMHSGDFHGASYYYSLAAKADSTDMQYWMLYANALRMNNDYRKAANTYQYVFEYPNRPERFEDALYYWGKMLQSLGQYDSAEFNFSTYMNYYAMRGGFLYKDAKQQAEACKWAANHVQDSVPHRPENLGIGSNSNYAEFGGSLLNDSTLIYSSLQFFKKDSSMELAKIEEANRFQLMKAIKRDSIWYSEGNLDSMFNVEGAHVANACFYPDSNWLVFSECADPAACVIKLSRKTEDGWTEPELLAPTINLEGFNNTQPYITSIGAKTYLFFVSNRPQGKGKLDIWYSEYNKRYKDFTYPKNMGRNVNTAGNEITPYFMADSNRLYFSSDWHEGFGGFDIFQSSATSLRSARPPENLGLPINSPANDLYFSWPLQDSAVFLSSNREGGFRMENQTCCNDIYSYTISAPVIEEVDTPEVPVDTISPVDTPVVPILVTVEQINEYLPVLYFHNDQPNPRSWAKTTDLTYQDCYEEYLELREEYIDSYSQNKPEEQQDSAKKAIKSFYRDKILKGRQEFDVFCELLLTQVTKGEQVVLTIKGYASPLAKSDYNLNLTQRRIESLINYFKVYKEGALLPYFETAEEGKGHIEIERIPYGESKASAQTSDNLDDKINSVYSPSAMEDRRIEILKVSRQSTD
ncbi:PD40 domain-containing protein [bacterium SCSIO 12741]|nr:PD40 domain-containing protein [bacterium SCSIO 12741]